MPTEVEELKLRITLDDGASAQLTRVRQELSQIGSGPVAQGLGQATVKATEADKAFGSLARSFLGVGRSAMDFAKVIGPMPVAIATVGYELIRTIASLKEWSAQAVQLNNAARASGVGIGAFRGISSQLAASGTNAQQAASMMMSLSRAMSEVNRPGSALRESLLNMAGPEFSNAMSDALVKLANMRGAVERTNYIREMGLNVYANKFRETHDEMQARYAQYLLLQQFGMEKLINQKRQLHELDKRTQENMKYEAKIQDEFNEKVEETAEKHQRIVDIFETGMAPAASKVLDIWNKGLDVIIKSGNEAEKFRRENEKAPWSKWMTHGAAMWDAPKSIYDQPWNTQNLISNPFAGMFGGVPKHQAGGIVTQPHVGMVGEAGPEAIIPLDQMDQMSGGQKHTETVEDNTKQLRMLNDQLDQILNPSRVTQISQGMGGAGPGAGGGGDGTGPGGTGRGPGGTSDGPTAPAAPGEPGGPAIDMSSARLGMSPAWDDPNIKSPATAPGTMMRAIRSGGGLTTGGFPGAPRMQWPAQGGGGAGGLGGGVTGGDKLTALPNGHVDPIAYYKAAVEKFRNSPLNGYVPTDGAKYGIVSGTPEEYARAATATAMQESSFNANAPGGGLNQFNEKDLRNYGIKGAVNDPNSQLDALVAQWSKHIPADKVFSEPGAGPGGGWGGAGRYFGSWRHGPRGQAGAHMTWANQIAGQAGAVPTSPTAVAGAHPFVGYGPYGTSTQVAGAAGGGTVTVPGGANIVDESAQLRMGNFGKFGPGGPQGLIVHHTGGNEASAEAVAGVLKGRTEFGAQGLSSNYVIDKAGRIVQIEPEGARGAHILPASKFLPPGDPRHDISNMNYLGVEVIGKEDKDWTPEQRAAIQSLYATLKAKYHWKDDTVYGHSEVNPGHRENEGEVIAKQLRSGALSSQLATATSTPTQVAGPTSAALPTSDTTPASPFDTFPKEDTRATLDRMMGKETQKQTGDTSGTIKIKHSKAKGSTLTHRKPAFKDVPDNRQTQFLPAADGPQITSWRDTVGLN
jgi:hypothetical protein